MDDEKKTTAMGAGGRSKLRSFLIKSLSKARPGLLCPQHGLRSRPPIARELRCYHRRERCWHNRGEEFGSEGDEEAADWQEQQAWAAESKLELRPSIRHAQFHAISFPIYRPLVFFFYRLTVWLRDLFF